MGDTTKSGATSGAAISLPSATRVGDAGARRGDAAALCASSGDCALPPKSGDTARNGASPPGGGGMLAVAVAVPSALKGSKSGTTAEGAEGVVRRISSRSSWRRAASSASSWMVVFAAENCAKRSSASVFSGGGGVGVGVGSVDVGGGIVAGVSNFTTFLRFVVFPFKALAGRCSSSGKCSPSSARKAAVKAAQAERWEVRRAVPLRAVGCARRSASPVLYCSQRGMALAVCVIVVVVLSRTVWCVGASELIKIEKNGEGEQKAGKGV